jgi:CheY-like chemotaxis protein
MPDMNTSTAPILIVEDNPHVRELLEVTLRFKGYPVASVTNGVDALEWVAKEMPALLITDILMPKMDGFSLAHRLRKDPNTANIPIIFISATYLTHEDKAFALSLGAARFIEKPIDPADLLLTVAEILTQGQVTTSEPLEDRRFFLGYRERLENKLKYKKTQIARTERLLQSLPAEQRPAFESLLKEAIANRDEIEVELNQLIGDIEQDGAVGKEQTDKG